MFDKPADEWTREDWARLYEEAFHLSEKLLFILRNPEGRETYSPQVAGFALIVAMGRHAGKDAFRHIPVDDVWKLWTDESARAVFDRAFEFERRSEN